MPIGLAAVVIAQAVYVSVHVSDWMGRRDEKLDEVVGTVTEIKAEMYRRSDAEKDREVLNLKVDNLTRRVEVLEAARQHQVALAQQRQEKQEDDLLTRAGRWISGK
jgi:hypothetical protein